MAVSLDSRVWLATHLLYPNSSQAFDVYQTLVTQSESSIKKNNLNHIFQKLYQIVSKISAISSNKPFHVFDEDKTEQWRQIYRKSQKEQLIVFVGYFVFDLKLKELSGITKMTFEKTQFLFHQTFKKATFTNIKMDVPEKIHFKKYSEEKVSFLFTNENLIDFCLQNLSSAEMKKVHLGLRLYPELQASQKQYDLIVKQMNDLMDAQVDRVVKSLIQTSETLSEPAPSLQITEIFARNKGIVAAATASVFILFMVIIRPTWIQNVTVSSKDHLIDLQEIKPKELIAENFEQREVVAAPAIEASKDQTTSTPTLVLIKPVDMKLVPTSTSIVAVTSPTSSVQLPKPVMANNAALVKHVPPLTEDLRKEGGLYRGVLVVTDINEVSAKITQRLVDLGGKKAGEVELGWKKTTKLAYYHFTLPENNVDPVKEFLEKFGHLQIQFENHPRLMPPGVKRLIIEVKERE